MQVAIKFLERGPGITKSVLREILNHRLLVSHPYIVKFREVFLTQRFLGACHAAGMPLLLPALILKLNEIRLDLLLLGVLASSSQLPRPCGNTSNDSEQLGRQSLLPVSTAGLVHAPHRARLQKVHGQPAVSVPCCMPCTQCLTHLQLRCHAMQASAWSSQRAGTCLSTCWGTSKASCKTLHAGPAGHAVSYIPDLRLLQASAWSLQRAGTCLTMC